jgi:FkbM family methyltransferase
VAHGALPAEIEREIRMLRSIVEKVGRALGLVIVPDWRAVRLDEERHLGRLLRHLEIDCVFDVGANVGQYGQMLRKYVGFEGQIISFEPNPEAFEKLQALATRDGRWHTEQFAFGKAPGTAEFNVFAMSELSSLRDLGSSTHAPHHMPKKTISVQVRTLADYFAQAKETWRFKRPFLKLDTQGFDLDVAKGAGAVLSEFLGLQSEIAFQTIYEGAPDFAVALSFYRDAGFTLSRLVPIHEVHFPELVEMDVIMVRTSVSG